MSTTPENPRTTPLPADRGAEARPATDVRTTETRGTAAPQRTREPRRANTPGWLSLLAALALMGLQIYGALNARQLDAGDGMLASVLIFGTLVLGLVAAILGLVGLAQRGRPRWPSYVGLSIGVYAFVIAVFSWIGGQMNSAGL